MGIHGHLALVNGSGTVLRFEVDPTNYRALSPVRRVSRHQLIGASSDPRVAIQDMGIALLDTELTFSGLLMTQATAKTLHSWYRAADPTYTLKDWAGHEWTVFLASVEMGPRIEFRWGPTKIAAGGGASTITLASDAVGVDDFYIDAKIRLVSGTGAGQSRKGSDYVGSSRILTVSPAWTTAPISGTGYQMADTMHEVNMTMWPTAVAKLFAVAP